MLSRSRVLLLFRHVMQPRRLLLALALLTGVLYSSMLPLWSGFDEPFHYSYVETLVLSHSFPVLQHTRITTEVRDSFNLAPLSRFLKEMIPGSTSLEEWTKLSEGEKLSRRAALEKLPTSLRRHSSESPPVQL